MMLKKNLICLLLILGIVSSCKKNNAPAKENPTETPQFLYASPTDKSIDVPLNQEITLNYSTNITVSSSHNIIVNGQKANVTTSEKKLKFNITLEIGKTYNIIVPDGAITSLSGGKAPAVSLSFTTVSESKRYEAEGATLGGNAVVENSKPDFSGTGYVNQKDGDLSFKVSVPSATKYKIAFRFSNDNSKKENDIYINNVKLATIVFDPASTWKTISINNVVLKAGENNIAIKKNWGWTYYDYIDISPATDETPFNLSPTLVTANPSIEAVKVYNFLKDNFGKKVISGAMANYSTGLEEAQWMFDNTGKWPALTGFDFINHNRTWATDLPNLVTNAKAWWQNNGLVTLMWHWRDPSKVNDGFYTKDTNFDITKVNDPSSNEYKAMLADIDNIATYLKQLKDNNVPVLWRPLHEASGAWFWWGAKGPDPCKKLWKLMYDRLVNHHQLNNLIWVWTTDAADNALDWYPGDEYVDIIGMDIYAGENQHGSQYIAFDKIKALYKGKKILTLSECGSIPIIDAMFEYGDTWSWFMPWNGDYTRADKHNGVTFIKSVFNNEKVITRDKMPSLK